MKQSCFLAVVVVANPRVNVCDCASALLATTVMSFLRVFGGAPNLFHDPSSEPTNRKTSFSHHVLPLISFLQSKSRTDINV